MLKSPSGLGLLFGLAVIALGFVVEYPPVIGWGLIVFIFGGWLVFAIKDRRDARSQDR